MPELSTHIIFSFAFINLIALIPLFVSGAGSYKRSRVFFALFTLVQSMNLFYAFMILKGWEAQFPYVLQLNHLFQLVTPGLIFLLTVSIVRPDKRIGWSSLLVLLPLVFGIVLLWSFFNASTAEKVEYQRLLSEGVVGTRFKLLYLVKLLLGLTLIVLSIRHLVRHEKLLFSFYSNVENRTLVWLRNALILFLGIWFSVIVLRLFMSYEHMVELTAITVGAINLFLMYRFVTCEQFRRAGEEAEMIFSRNLQEQGAPEEEERNEELVAAFRERVAEQKPYLNPGCDLKFFSDAIDMKPYIVSSILNKDLGTTFYDFVGDLRAARAMELLCDERGKQLTIDSIAEESGFKSKATFYKAFKKKYAKTPSYYLKKTSN